MGPIDETLKNELVAEEMADEFRDSLALPPDFDFTQLEQLDDLPPEQQRLLHLAILTAEAQRCREDFEYFCHTIFDTDLTWFQKQWFEAYHNNPYALVIGPRGFRKTSILVKCYGVWRIIKDQNIRILVASETIGQAETFLRDLTETFEANPEFRAIFGDYVGKDMWTSTEITIRGRVKSYREATVTAVGFGTSLPGRHFDLILCDDIVSEENARTRLRRERLRTWFYKVLYGARELTSGKPPEIKVSGVRFHPRDLHGEFMEKEFKNSFIITPALNDKGESIWPEVVSTEELMKTKLNMGTGNFYSQYMGSVDQLRGDMFREEWFEWYTDSPTGARHYTGVDLAHSLDEEADYFSVVTIGVDHENQVYVESVIRDRVTLPEQLRIIQNEQRRWNSELVGIETNSFQILIPSIFGWFINDTPIVPIHNRLDKISRFTQLAAIAESGRIRLRRGSGAVVDLLDEMLAIPSGPNDDMADALEIACRVGLQTQVGYFDEWDLESDSEKKMRTRWDRYSRYPILVR